MAITLDRVREIFKGLENGDGAAFFEHVADNVDWTVEGTHPLAGHYQSKSDFRAHTFENSARSSRKGHATSCRACIGSADWADVEVRCHRDSTGFADNRYCWVCPFSAGKIIEVRAYARFGSRSSASDHFLRGSRSDSSMSELCVGFTDT
jgi:ketosteroid isomerase-like protein